MGASQPRPAAAAYWRRAFFTHRRASGAAGSGALLPEPPGPRLEGGSCDRDARVRPFRARAGDAHGGPGDEISAGAAARGPGALELPRSFRLARRSFGASARE